LVKYVIHVIRWHGHEAIAGDTLRYKVVDKGRIQGVFRERGMKIIARIVTTCKNKDLKDLKSGIRHWTGNSKTQLFCDFL
jgi:hypothetical protein